MTLSDWQSAMQQAEVAPEGFTTADVAKALNLSRRGAREKLQTAQDRGIVEHVGFRTEMDVSGNPHRVPVYRWRKNGSKSKTKGPCTPDHEHNHTGCTFPSCPPKARRR